MFNVFGGPVEYEMWLIMFWVVDLIYLFASQHLISNDVSLMVSAIYIKMKRIGFFNVLFFNTLLIFNL